MLLVLIDDVERASDILQSMYSDCKTVFGVYDRGTPQVLDRGPKCRGMLTCKVAWGCMLALQKP